MISQFQFSVEGLKILHIEQYDMCEEGLKNDTP